MTHRQLRIDSNLTFSVDGPSGTSAGRVDANGSKVTISVTDPGAIIGPARGSGHRHAAAVGELLAQSGVTVEVVGPQGSMMTVGAGVDSTVGALLGGTRHLRLGSLRATGPLVRARLTPATRVRRPVAVAAASVIALAFAGQWLRSRRQPP